MKKRKDGRYEQSIKIDGNRHVFYGRTIQEVRRKMVEFQEKKEKGPLFSQVADEWQAEKEKQVTSGTMKPYIPAVARAKKRFDGAHITEITSKQIHNYILSVAEKGLSAKTVSNQLSVLGMIFRKAMIDGYIESSPTEVVKIPAGLKRTARELPSDDDIIKIYNAKDSPFWLYAFLVMHTGLRRGEALALTYQDIDRENGVISINKTVWWDNLKRPQIKAPKTKAGIRTVPLLPPLAEALPPLDIGYVFPGEGNGLMGENDYARRWKEFSQAAGISCTAHQLRHMMATFCFEAGLDEKDAQDILGHADISTTHKIYTHIRDSRRKSNFDKLSQLFTSEFRQDAKKCDDSKV